MFFIQIILLNLLSNKKLFYVICYFNYIENEKKIERKKFFLISKSKKSGEKD